MKLETLTRLATLPALLVTACSSDAAQARDASQGAAKPADIEIVVKESEPRQATPSAHPLKVASASAPVGLCGGYFERVRACTMATLPAVDEGTRAQVLKAMDDARDATTEAWEKLDESQRETLCKALNDALSNTNCPPQ